MPIGKYLLKILSGPHQGAEVALEEEELVIGSSPECDFILSDTLVGPQHVKVVVSAEGLSIVPLEASVYLDGQEIPKEGHPLEPFQFVTLGTTHFVIGPVEGEWPALSAADVPALKKLEKEVSEEAPEEGEAGEEKPTAEEGEAPKEETAKKPEAIPVPAVLKEPKNIFIGAGALCFLLILGAAFVFFFLQSDQDKKSEAEEEVDLISQVRPILISLGVEEDFRIEESTGRITLEGWVKDNDDRDSIVSAFAHLGPSVFVQAWSQEQIMSNIKDLLGVWKMPISAESIEPGKVRIFGYYGNTKAWEDAKNNIEDDVRGIKLLKDDVLTAVKLSPIASMVLAEYQLEGKVQIIPEKRV